MPLTWFQYLTSALGFGGSIPEAEMTQIESEGISFAERNIRMRVSLRRPGKISAGAAKVTLIVTRQRLLLYTGAIPIVDIAFTDPAFARLRFEIAEGDRLTIFVPLGIGTDRWNKFDRTFHLKLPSASQAHDLLISHQ